jgi:hypothetical protein
MTHPAAIHCSRAALAGCGCKHCDAWRKALAAHRAERDAMRRGEPVQTALDLTPT